MLVFTVVALSVPGFCQSSPDVTSALYRGAYRNALHFLASVHSRTGAVGTTAQADADDQLCATIGISRTDLAILINEDGTLSSALSLAHSPVSHINAENTGSQPSLSASSTYTAKEIQAVVLSRQRLASLMSSAAMKAFDTYMVSTILPATHFMSPTKSPISGGLSK